MMSSSACSFKSVFLVCNFVVLLSCVSLFGVEFYLRTMKYKELVSDLGITQECLECCMIDEPCVHDEKCREKIDSNVCETKTPKEENSKKSIDRILQIVEEKVKEDKPRDYVEAHLKGNYPHEVDNLKHQLNHLNNMVYKPSKPVAHLCEALDWNKGPTPTGKKNEYRNNNWRYSDKIQQARLLHGMAYNSTTGALTVPLQGNYFVYLHTTFYTQYQNKSHEHCKLGHVVKRQNNNEKFNIAEEDLVKGRESRTCSFENIRFHVNRDMKNESDIGFHTLHLSGVHKLNEGDQLTVFYNMPPHIGLASLNRESYFGVFML